MIEFRGTLNETLYARGLRRHDANGRFIGIVLVAAGIYGIVTMQPSSQSYGIPLGVLGLGVFLLTYAKFYAWRAIRTNALMREGFSGRADETAVVIETSGGRSEILWDKFYRVRVAPDIVLLYVSFQQFLILPREFFAEADWQSFQDLAASRVRRKGGSRSVLTTFLIWVAIIVAVFVFWSLKNTR